MRSREVGGTPSAHPGPAVRVTGRQQPLLERAAGEAASPQQNDLGVRMFTSRERETGGKGEEPRNFKPENGHVK